LKRKKKDNGKPAAKEKLAALFAGALCIPLFWAAFFIFGKFAGGPPEGGGPGRDGTPLAGAPPAGMPEIAAPLTVRPPTTRNPPEDGGLGRDGTPLAGAPPAGAPPPTRQPVLPAPERKGSVVYVIDDAGNNPRELEPFLRFPGPLTVAVLPGLPHSARAARMAREAGKEVILHQPMQALGGEDPGPGAIYSGMSESEIRAVLEKNIAEIGPVAGMNNHQGSMITEDGAIMKTVLEFCHENGLYFLDSRTTAGTVAPEISRELGVTIAERNIFLDNEQGRDAIMSYLEQGLSIARKKNTAVMIGHAWSPELAGILSDLYAGLTAEGYTFATVSDVVREKTSR
jgi:polysaccharide deacetylase 2 family uncharacterized protein YibQ